MIISMFRPTFAFKEYVLETLNLLCIKSCDFWVKQIETEQNIYILKRDKRGRYKRALFYEIFPDIEKQARLFAIENATKKECSFTVHELATHITKVFKNQYPELFDRYFFIISLILVFKSFFHDNIYFLNKSMVNSKTSLIR